MTKSVFACLPCTPSVVNTARDTAREGAIAIAIRTGSRFYMSGRVLAYKCVTGISESPC
jgi:hypothetical protein